MRRWLVLFLFLVASGVSWAESFQRDEDLKKIYLYTMVIFMQDLQARYEESPNAPQAWLMLRRLHQERIGYSHQKSDYHAIDTSFLRLIQSHFSPQQQEVMQDRQLFDINTLSGQVLYYELIYKEHPLGGFHFLPTIADLRERLTLAFGSQQMADFLLDDEVLWGEYLSLWMLLVRSHNREFQALMDSHIEEYNQELLRLNRAGR